VSIRELYHDTPPASRGHGQTPMSMGVVVWERDDGKREITVGHSTYTPDQAMALANSILAAVAKAGEPS
jgi:hypothetical protein